MFYPQEDQEVLLPYASPSNSLALILSQFLPVLSSVVTRLH